MTVLVFLDLDDTIMQILPKCPPHETLSPVAFDRADQPISHMTRHQQQLLAWLHAAATVVPVTARTMAAFSRVRLPFAAGAILNHGATMVDAHGAVDEAWHERTVQVIAPQRSALHAIHARLQAQAAGNSATVQLIAELDCPLYVTARCTDQDLQVTLHRCAADFMTDLRLSWSLWRHGKYLTILPEGIGKEIAVRHWMSAHESCHGPQLTIGIGDALSDLDFMRACHMAMLPRTSELMASLHHIRTAPEGHDD
jgi:phosphoserine phosphatase